MSDIICNVEEIEGAATAYQVNDSSSPAFDCVNAVKSHHAETQESDYRNLVARKVAENHSKGHFVVVVVDLGGSE